jgi:DNA-binding CsgD family transcriptional regulator
MADLAARDYARMLDLAVAVIDGEATAVPLALIAQQISECVHGDFGAFSSVWPAVPTGRVIALPDHLRDLPQEVFAPHHIDRHPMVQYYMGSGDTTPRTLDEIDVQRSWRRGEDYQRLREAAGVTHQMIVMLHAPQGCLRSFVVARTNSRDFTARDRAAARQLQPLLVGVDNHLRELRRIRSLLPDPQACRASAYGLTPRETTVLALLAENLTAASIAHRLGISVSTVNTHLERLYRKLGTNNRLTTVLLAREAALIPHQLPGCPANAITG